MNHYLKFVFLLTVSIGGINGVASNKYGSGKVLGQLRHVRASDEDGSCVLPMQPFHGHYLRSGQIEEISSNSLVNQFTRIDFSCSPNFVINGAARSYCIEGKWTPEPPICSRTCKPLKSSSMEYECSLNNTSIPCSTPMLAGTKANVRCKENYKTIAFSHDIITCNNDGEWQESYVICTPECGTLGKNSTNEVIPWHATIYERVGTETKKICSGSIVNANTILTAAHCLCNDTTVKNKNAFTITINSLKKYARKLEDTILLSKIKEIVVHPGYFGEDSNQQYDIALIVLVNIIEFTPAVKPVCIDWGREGYDDNIYPGKIVQTTGWTSTIENGGKDPQMRQLNLRVVSRDECREWSPREVKPFITRDKFCATFLNESDGTIQSFSAGGGVLFVENVWSGPVFYIEGIASVKTNDSLIASTTVVKYFKFLKTNNVHKNVEPFACTSGDLISSKDRCDGISDCEDNSDEADELCEVPVASLKPIRSPSSTETSIPSVTTEPSEDLIPSESSIPLASVGPSPTLTLPSAETIKPPEVLNRVETDDDSVSTTSSQDLVSTQTEGEPQDYEYDEPDNSVIDCIPPVLKNGQYKITEHPSWHKNFIYYTCDFPYVLVGDISSLCNKGEWVHAPPLCLSETRTGDDALIPVDCSEVKSNVSGMYEIWPKLTEKPFPAYCDFDYLNSKWTVIQKRFDGSVDFNRSFQEYVDGFGDLNGGEHWLGLKNFYGITKHEDYELYILLTDFDNQTRFIQYEKIYMGGFQQYDEIHGNAVHMGNAGNGFGSIIGAIFCTHDRHFGSFQAAQDCLEATDFGWWKYSNTGPPYSNLNGPYVNETFARQSNGLTWGPWHQNYSLKSTQMMVRRLSDNFNVTGALKNIYPEDCGQVDSNVSGVFIIQPTGAPQAFNVFCDISDNNKWTVIQNRFDVDGSKGYFAYDYLRSQIGYGDLDGVHWLGLERIYQLTKNGGYELLIQLTDDDNATRLARYGDFSIGSADDGYRLNVAQYRGTAGDSLTSHDGSQFSTFDHDADTYSGSCAEEFGGSWWYDNCFDSDLNAGSIIWSSWHGFDYQLSSSRMSIRKKIA